MPVVKVHETASLPSVSRPLLVDALPEDLPADLSLNLLQNESLRKSKQLVLRGENERIKFDAANFGQCSSIASAFSYALVYVDDNEKDVVNIVGPCERLSGRRTVRCLEGIVDKTAKEPKVDLDYKTAQNALGEAFGTKKRKQAIHSLEKNQIDMARLQATSANFINKSIDETIVSRLPSPDPSDNLSLSSDKQYTDNGILPPLCLNADKPQDCYPLIGKLIPNDIWMSLPEFNDESSFTCSLNPDLFVKERLKFVFSSQESPNANFIAAYLNYLLKLSALKESQFNDPKTTSSILFGVTIDARTRILSEFSESVVTNGGKHRFKLPAAKKDRLVLHICVLALHLEPGMKICVNELAKEMGLSVTKMAQYFKALGCTIDTQGKKGGDGRNTQTRYARLSVPLSFPKPPLKR